MKRLVLWIITGLALLFIFIQFVPLTNGRTNPLVIQEPSWDSPATRALAVRACYDCHSNETIWPWYSTVAPISWLVIRDTNEGRAVLNFSEWQRSQEEAQEAAETVLKGTMPLRSYLIAHPEARLSAAEQANLAQGLQKTLGGELEHDNEGSANGAAGVAGN